MEYNNREPLGTAGHHQGALPVRSQFWPEDICMPQGGFLSTVNFYKMPLSMGCVSSIVKVRDQ